MNKSNNFGKHVLIIGGMGPQASLYAHKLVLEQANLLGATENEQYPRVTHLSVNVKDFISNPKNREEAKKYLLECLSEIDFKSVDAAFIACNTAHVLFDDIQKATGIRLTSLIDVAEKNIKSTKSLKKVGLLSTPSTLKMDLYSTRISKYVEVMQPNKNALSVAESIIREVISGNDELLEARKLQEQVDKMIHAGADKVLLGCTELSLLSPYLNQNTIIDPLFLTVKAVLK